jgi:hypothetical protein
LEFTLHGTTTFPQLLMGILESTTVIARVPPKYNVANVAATSLVRGEVEFTIGGLTPGASLTWDVAMSVETAVASSGIKCGGPNDTTANNAFGAFIYELWDVDPYPTNFKSTSIDGNGRVDAIKIAGTTQTARDIGASVLVSAGTGAGQLDFTSGRLNVNTTHADGTAWNSGALTGATIGSGYISAITSGLATSSEVLPMAMEVSSIFTDTGTSIPATLAIIAGYLDTEITDIKGVTDKLDTALELDGSVYRFTTNALEQAPSGGGGGTDWTTDEKTAIRSILGIPASGTAPDDPTTGILDTIRDAVGVVDGVVDAIIVDTAEIGAAGAGLTALAPASTALSTAVWTSTIAGRIDAAITTRQETFTIPTNFASLNIDGSGHIILQNNSLTTNKLGTFALAKTTNITGFNDVSAAQVNTEADTALSDVGATLTRYGYLDKLNITGNVASSAEVTAIQNNTRIVFIVPEQVIRPTTGTTTVYVRVYLYDSTGNMEAPDSAPTIEVRNAAGTDLTSRLVSATGTLESTGVYRWAYTSSSTDSLEQILWSLTIVEGGVTRANGRASWVTDTYVTDFTTSDRTALNSIVTTLSSPVDSNVVEWGGNPSAIQNDPTNDTPLVSVTYFYSIPAGTSTPIYLDNGSSTFPLVGTARLQDINDNTIGIRSDVGGTTWWINDLRGIRGTEIPYTEGSQERMANAFSTQYNVATPVFTSASVNQTGDTFSRIGNNGSSLTQVGLADGAITDAKITFPPETAGRPTTFLAAMRRVWEWATNKRTRNRTTGIVSLQNAADTSTLETQTQSTVDVVDTQTQGS